MSPAALRAIVDAADALARLAREASAGERHSPDAMVPLAEAAHSAGTSLRVVRDATTRALSPPTAASATDPYDAPISTAGSVPGSCAPSRVSTIATSSDVPRGLRLRRVAAG